MKLYRAAQMQEADRRAPAAGVSLKSLMHAAGHAVAREAVAAFPSIQHWHVLVGPGNNGGDGWVAALGLLKRGRPTTVWELAVGRARTGPASSARQAFLTVGGKHQQLISQALLGELSAPGAGVIDALFGNGLNRPLAGELLHLVRSLERKAIPVVAVDIPSGLDPDLAETDGPHLRSDLTVALAELKPAHVFEPARSACGLIRLADIGFPAAVLEACSDITLLQPADIAAHLPLLKSSGHKYEAGTICLIAGSARYRGAAELAARAAWRSGAGLVTLVSDGTHSGAWPETIFEAHDWSASWPPEGLSPSRAAAIVVGPGLAQSALRSLAAILDWAPGPVILDAAALTPDALAGLLPLPRQRPVVLTPHAGEAERLLARLLPGREGLVRTDPLAAAAALAKHLQVTVVLKGPATVIADASGGLAVSTRGHPAMATGGTGDALAGVLAATLARPLTDDQLFGRVCAAVVLHGLAGEIVAASYGEGLTASDVVAVLPEARARIVASRADPNLQ